MCNFAWKRRDMAGKPPCAGVGMVGERRDMAGKPPCASVGMVGERRGWRANRHAQVEVVGMVVMVVMVGKIVIM